MSYLSPAALVVSTIAIPLSSSRLYLDGIQYDQGFRTQFLGRMTETLGNHDMNYEATSDSLSDETFERNFGPATYSFNYGQAHFIIFDDILYPDPRDQKGYWGGFRKDQLDFMENDLKTVPKDKLVICAFHIPLQQYADSYHRNQNQAGDVLQGKSWWIDPTTGQRQALPYLGPNQGYVDPQSGNRYWRDGAGRYAVLTPSGQWYWMTPTQ